tara:strand:- start:14 stop:178 length:165 start_codon:yes stop_codon:yes gene_type:complete
MPCLIRRNDGTIAYLSKENEKMLGRTPRPKPKQEEKKPITKSDLDFIIKLMEGL